MTRAITVPAPSEAGTRDAGLALQRCDELAQITAVPGRIDRFYLTPEHGRGNNLVAGWMADAGMRPWQDAVGNQVGLLGTGDRPRLLLGSHLDTVPDAGRYDGPLGVMIAIAVVQRLRERGEQLPFDLEVLGFSDEEGTRFGMALMGSRGAAGTWDERWWSERDDDGVTLEAKGREIFETLLRVASGERSKSEQLGYGDAEFVPWQIGATM